MALLFSGQLSSAKQMRGGSLELINALSGFVKLKNKMNIVYKIAVFDTEGKLTLLDREYITYPEAERGIDKLPAGTYQVQKVFVKY